MASNKKFLPSLTGLRGLAALMVFGYHARWRAGNPSMLLGSIDLRSLLLACDGGVGIFFVLSGFLLSEPYWRNLLEDKRSNIDLQHYFIRRILRIAPAYYLSLIHTHFFNSLTYTFWGIISLILYFLGLHTFFHQSYEWGINPVLWSIGIEVQFYILLPVLFLIVRKFFAFKVSYNWLPLAGITILCFTLNPAFKHLALSVATYLPDTILGGEDAATSLAVNRSIFYFLPWFWVGIVSSWIHQIWICKKILHLQLREKFYISDFLILIGILGTTFILMNASEGEWGSFSYYGWPANCLFFSLLVLFSPYSKVGKLLFDNFFMIFIGEISYGIYLWHSLIQVSVFQGSLPYYFDGFSLFIVGGIVSLLITILIASLSYFWVERPFVLLARRCRSFSELWKYIKIKFSY